MIKSQRGTLFVLTCLCASTSLHAQSGCTDSPEAPTMILLLVGMAGMFYGSSLLMKMLRQKSIRRSNVR